MKFVDLIKDPINLLVNLIVIIIVCSVNSENSESSVKAVFSAVPPPSLMVFLVTNYLERCPWQPLGTCLSLPDSAA